MWGGHIWGEPNADGYVNNGIGARDSVGMDSILGIPTIDSTGVNALDFISSGVESDEGRVSITTNCVIKAMPNNEHAFFSYSDILFQHSGFAPSTGKMFLEYLTPGQLNVYLRNNFQKCLQVLQNPGLIRYGAERHWTVELMSILRPELENMVAHMPTDDEVDAVLGDPRTQELIGGSDENHLVYFRGISGGDDPGPDDLARMRALRTALKLVKREPFNCFWRAGIVHAWRLKGPINTILSDGSPTSRLPRILKSDTNQVTIKDCGYSKSINYWGDYRNNQRHARIGFVLRRANYSSLGLDEGAVESAPFKLVPFTSPRVDYACLKDLRYVDVGKSITKGYYYDVGLFDNVCQFRPPDDLAFAEALGEKGDYEGIYNATLGLGTIYIVTRM